MKKPLLRATLLCFALTGQASAETHAWSSGWGMGVTEYTVDDGNRNALTVACPDRVDESAMAGGHMSAHALIDGREYASDTLSGGDGFDVVIDGETWRNPFFTDCRVCGDNFPAFWQALRQANHLVVSADGVVAELPTANLADAVPPLDSPANTCRSAW